MKLILEVDINNNDAKKFVDNLQHLEYVKNVMQIDDLDEEDRVLLELMLKDNSRRADKKNVISKLRSLAYET